MYQSSWFISPQNIARTGTDCPFCRRSSNGYPQHVATDSSNSSSPRTTAAQLISLLPVRNLHAPVLRIHKLPSFSDRSPQLVLVALVKHHRTTLRTLSLLPIMASKPTDSQELKLAPGWTSLSKNNMHSSNHSSSSAVALPSAAPRIAYTKAQLLELYEPGSTARIPTAMTKYPGLTSSEPLVPVNIAPDDHIAHVSALVNNTDPALPRTRFQSTASRAGVDSILVPDYSPSSNHISSSPSPPSDIPSSSPPPKKSAHVTTSSREFWSGSAVLAPAERPAVSAALSVERRPLTLKPRSTAPDRAPSPNSTTTSSQQQPYWSRSSGRNAADSNSNWRGGNSSVASGGAKYPGSSNEELSANISGSPGERVTQPRKVPDFSGTSTSTRSGFSRDGGLFSRNNKDTLKPTNTRDLSALTKGSTRDQTSSAAVHQDRDSRESRPHHSENTHRSQYDIMADQRKLWFYKDPQQVSQGPFTASQIMEWHKAGYYNEELPVSKNREHGFKPLAVAFGLRKDEASVPPPPPGFVKDSTPSKKEGQISMPPSSSRPSRDDRGRRGGRTVEELAEEVEMMRLQNHRKAQEKSNMSSDIDSGKEKSFFDITSRDKKSNDHRMMNVRLEKPKKEVVEPALKFAGGDDIDMEKSRLASTNVAISQPLKPTAPSRIVESPPPKQSRLAAFMGQGLIDSEETQTNLPTSSSGFKDTSGESVLPAISHTILNETAPSSASMRPAVQQLPPELVEKKNIGDPALSTPWKTMMMDIRQQNGRNRAAPVSQSKTEQDLMAIDPAIAHASFARPSLPVSSEGPSAHISSNSQDLPAWLQFNTAAEAATASQRRDGLQDVNSRLSAHLPGHNPLGPRSAAQELSVLQAPTMRAQAEYEALERARQAQAQAQAQQMRKLQLQQQIQAQVSAAQRSGNLARAQAQAQTQSQATAQLHSPARDHVWVMQHQLNQLQHRFDLECRAHVEFTRTVQAARAAAAAIGGSDPDHQGYLTIAAQAEAMAKQHAVATERIKAVAGNTHAQLLHLAQEQQQQQQRGIQNLASQVPAESFRGSTNLAGNQSGLQSPTPQTVTSQVQPSAPPTGYDVKRVEGPQIDDRSSAMSSDHGDLNHSAQRALREPYDSIVQNDAQGWERVNRKPKPSAPGTSVMRNTSGAESELNLGSDLSRVEQRDRAAVISSSMPTQASSKQTNVDVDALTPSAMEAADRSRTHEEAGRPERNSMESVSTAAPWSKTSAQVSANGLSLREIQRQEELRSKAQEKVVIVQPEPEEARVPPPRWNTVQPWGGAGDPSKQRSMSLREQMRYEEEQRKKPVSVTREAAPCTNGPTPTTNTKTGWASLVANSKPSSNRQNIATAGRNTDEETSFWDSVSGGTPAAPSAVRRAQKSNYPLQAQPAPQVHGNATNIRQTPIQNKGSLPHRASSPARNSKSERRDSGSEVVISGRISHEFAKWCTDNLQQLTGNPNQDTTLVQYLMTIKSPSEIRETVVQNLGATDEARSFADEFIRRLEFEKPNVMADSASGNSAGRKKGRRQRAARVDPSLVLGFTSTSSSSRIMQGTIETPEMK